MRSLTLVHRLAAALALLLLVSALAVMLIPSSSDAGAPCGTWISPEWTEELSVGLVDDYADLSEGAGPLVDQDELAANAGYVANAYRDCSTKLDGRRLTTVILAVAALLLPVLVLFVGGSRRPTEEPPTVVHAWRDAPPPAAPPAQDESWRNAPPPAAPQHDAEGDRH